jgi:two-component system nitrogen regulation response regulator GlnG
MPRLLVVDDEPNVLFSLQQGLGSEALEVVTAQTAREGIERVRGGKPDVVLLDVRLPDMSGLDAFEAIRAIDPRLPVVIITAFSTTETAIQAMKRGAYEYLLKPLDLVELRGVVRRALEQSRVTHVRALIDDEEAPADAEAERIVGHAPAMQAVYKAIGRAASQDVTVLITGETGTGKELVARAIYQHGLRSAATFLAINCAAIPETLLEAELFGHERGAFTGADRRRIGKFEQADGGTIFLDEVGDMTPATQAKVLRLIQDGQFERLGGTETIRSDVRLIAATNRDLDALIAAGRFRQDLYYRLKVFTIHLPPLRERPQDLPTLVEHFVKRLNISLGKQVRSIAPAFLACLEAHHWPGNVRELRAAMESAMVHATGEVLTPDCLPEPLRDCGTFPPAPAPDAEGVDVAGLARRLLQAGEADVYDRVIAAVDRVVLAEALRAAQGSQVRASELLGISRNTLRAKLRANGPQPGSEPDQPV